MAWRNARSLDVLAAEIWDVAPGTTVWTIGDKAHAASWSDHNPNQCCAVVCAADILSDAGLDLQWLVDTITRVDPPALKYVIFRDRIWFPGLGWRPYLGEYHTHVHVSVGWGPDGRSTGPYDDESPWGLTEKSTMEDEDMTVIARDNATGQLYACDGMRSRRITETDAGHMRTLAKEGAITLWRDGEVRDGWYPGAFGAVEPAPPVAPGEPAEPSPELLAAIETMGQAAVLIADALAAGRKA